MVNTSYPVSGVVTDQAGANLEGARVTVYNKTKDQWLRESVHGGTTNSSGQYTIDLGNQITQWEDNDVIFLVFYERDADGAKFSNAEYRFLIDEGAGSTTQNAVIHSGPAMTGRGKVLSVSLSNTTGSALWVQLYDRFNDRYFKADCPAGDSKPVIYPRGKLLKQGLGLVLESDTTDEQSAVIQIGSSDGN